jgi:tRNA pseudouridine13 synthase
MASEESSTAPPAKRIRLSTPEELKDATMAGAEQNGSAKPDEDEETQLEKELKAGITSYISPDTPGFSGTLKQRYTDFLVNEILPSGRVLHLQSISAPSNKQDQKPEPKKEPKQAVSVGDSVLAASKSVPVTGDKAILDGKQYIPVSKRKRLFEYTISNAY